MCLRLPWLSKRARKLKFGRTALIATMLVAVATFRPVYAYEQRVAVLIGLEHYEVGRGKGIFRDLPFSTNDLEAVGKALKEIGFDRIFLYSDAEAPKGSDFEYRSLLPADEETSTVGSEHIGGIISQALHALKKKRNSLLFVYFTGHGGAFEGGDRVLALPNSKLKDPTSFSRVQMILEQMARTVERADKMLVVDACADDLGKGLPPYVTMRSEQLPVHLFSSSLGQMSFFDRRLKMSVFSYHFVEALKRADCSLGFGNWNGKIESEEVEAYVRSRVPKHGHKEQKKNDSDGKVPEQKPWGSGEKNLELGQSRRSASHPLRQEGESDEDWEARLKGFYEALYRRKK